MAVVHIAGKDFEKEVLKNSKPVVVDFWATWCGPCKMLSPVFEALSEEKKDMKFVKIDVDEAEDVAGDQDIRAVPTLIVFKGGKEIARRSGAMTKDQLKEFLKKAASEA